MASASAGTRLRQRPLLACASRAARAAHRDAAWSAPVLLLTAEAVGASAPRLADAALAPCFWGFAASGAAHGRQLRFRAVAPLSARQLHTGPPGKEATAGQHGRADSGGAGSGAGATPGVDVARDVHSSALAAREDSAPPREVRRTRATRSCVRVCSRRRGSGATHQRH
jgi:hypothetical protein